MHRIKQIVNALLMYLPVHHVTDRRSMVLPLWNVLIHFHWVKVGREGAYLVKID